jgi:hypothetical protein
LYAVTHCGASFRALVVTLAIIPTLPASRIRLFLVLVARGLLPHHPAAEFRSYPLQPDSASSAVITTAPLIGPYWHAIGTVSYAPPGHS